MSRIILNSADLDGYLTKQDNDSLLKVAKVFEKAENIFKDMESNKSESKYSNHEKELIDVYNEIGGLLQEIIGEEEHIKVYSFSTPKESHGEVSRLISKLRDPATERFEFIYYIQRAYELLFNLAFSNSDLSRKNYIISKTAVNIPMQNYAVHKIPDVDQEINNAVMCVMLRGALLPSMIMSKEIQEYSSANYVTPFALFRIKRDDTKRESDMEYILDLERSFFDLKTLNDKTLIFADPMNATGGSLITIVKYLREQGVRPKAVKFINIISALKGSLRIVRALEDVSVYTLWMDPVLNDAAYILPGLGDAGDRINGTDVENASRNIIQLLADYGSNITSLYRAQVRKIEEMVLG